MYLGDYIVIEHQTGPFEFDAVCVSTGTEFIARVVPDKQHIFKDVSFTAGHPSACPFLRPAGDGRIVCTIHETRPHQCRAFHCTSMLVYSRGGALIGKVNGNRAVLTKDRELRELWQRTIDTIPFSSPDIEQQMREAMSRHGYRVE
jgi:Fe-S-cluster containining protein